MAHPQQVQTLQPKAKNVPLKGSSRDSEIAQRPFNWCHRVAKCGLTPCVLREQEQNICSVIYSTAAICANREGVMKVVMG